MIAFVTNQIENKAEILEKLSKLQTKDRVDLSKQFQSYAAVGIQLRCFGSELQVLYVQRAKRESDPWSGQIGFPGGRVEEADQMNPLQTMQREFQEEMGAVPKSESEFCVLDDLQARRGGGLLPFFIRPICFYSEQNEFRYNQSEIHSHFWVSIKTLVDSKNFRKMDLARVKLNSAKEIATGQSEDASAAVQIPIMQAYAVQIPAVQISSDPSSPLLWGLTYMMTENLLRSLERIQLLQMPKEWETYPQRT